VQFLVCAAGPFTAGILILLHISGTVSVDVVTCIHSLPCFLYSALLNTLCFVYPRGILFFVGHSFSPVALQRFGSVAPVRSRDRSACWCSPAHPPLKFRPTHGAAAFAALPLERPILISIATRPPYHARSPRRRPRRDIQVISSRICMAN